MGENPTLDFPTGVRVRNFRNHKLGSPLAQFDFWESIKDEVLLHQHIFLGTYSQKMSTWQELPPFESKEPAIEVVDHSRRIKEHDCMPDVENPQDVMQVSARFIQRFDPGHALEDVFRYSSALSQHFPKLKHVNFTVVVDNWLEWVSILTSQEDVECWILSLEVTPPKYLTVFLELGKKKLSRRDDWNKMGREMFASFDGDIVNRVLGKLHGASD